MDQGRPAAFFDLDNTLIRGSSFYYFVRGLVTHGVISRRQILRFGWENFRYVRSRKENQATIAMVTRRALLFVQGMSQNFLRGVSEEIVGEFLPKRLIPMMKDRITEHKIVGNDTWLVTAAPQELAEVVAVRLGMSGALGTRAAVSEGVYRAELAEPTLHGSRKAEAVRNLATSHGYDLKKSFAYSDSLNDLPMLVAVGRPIAVNPEKELARIAIKNRWPLIETDSKRVLVSSNLQ
jgi:HAD superfamily hydrolase (TIGR01490 family)